MTIAGMNRWSCVNCSMDHSLEQTTCTTMSCVDIEKQNQRIREIFFHLMNDFYLDVVTVFQNEMAIINGYDNTKHLVGTRNCGPCIAFAGYEPINKIAFIAHFSQFKEVEKSADMILSNNPSCYLDLNTNY